MAESSTDTFMTGTGGEDEKSAQRLAALQSAFDPEEVLRKPADPASLIGDALANVVQEAAQQQEAAVKKKAMGIEEGAEEHWNVVMKKLAPTGYKKSPQWQKSIIDRVVRKMAGREKTGGGNPLTQGPSSDRSTVDLAAMGINADMASTVAADEKRFEASTLAMSPSRRGAHDMSSTGMSSTGKTTKRHTPDAAEQQQQENSNKVHFYIRATQGEQLVEQDLNADLKQMNEEVERAILESQGGFARTLAQTAKVERQIAIIKNRCQKLNNKASEVQASNGNVRLKIDDLRTEKNMHKYKCEKMRSKATKMDEDTSFLTQAAHQSLDQREKVKGKFMAAQRDAQQEREQKLSIIKELMERSAMLDDDWGLRESELEDMEEARKRKLYITGRLRRGELEAKETRYGFLANQVKGWDGEFQRLQAFTGMDSKYTPGEGHIVDEITNRFLEKERANTSLLRYLHEQQAEMTEIDDEQGQHQQLQTTIKGKLDAVASDGGAQDKLDAQGAGQEKDEARMVKVEATLESVGRIVHRTAGFLWFEGNAPGSIDETGGDCNVGNLEEWMRIVESRILEMLQASRTLCDRSDVEPPAVLREWVAPKPKKQLHSTGEIHEALLLQAQQQNSRKGDEDEDEEEAERAREKESKLSPFHRVKVDKAKERQQIVDWARKRQGQIRAAQQGVEMTKAITAAASATLGGPAMAGSIATALRGSTSAPSLPPPPPPDGKSVSAAAYSAQHASAPPQRGTADYGRAVRAAADLGAAEAEALQQRVEAAEAAAGAAGYSGAEQFEEGGVSVSAGGRGGRPAGKQPRKREAGKQPPRSSSMPWLGEKGASATSGGGGGGSRSDANSLGQTPKDLGTMIYLLGTQSNSMNARRLGSSSR